MNRKIRYAIVIIVALCIVSGVFFFVEREPKVNPVSISTETAEKASKNSSVDSGSTGVVSQSTSAVLASSSQEASTQVPSTAPTTVEPTTEASLIQPEIPENATGLLAYFRHKLVIDLNEVKYYLNVRKEPNEESEILAVLYANDIVTYTETSGNWYKVEMPDCTGYVHAGYVLADEKCYEAMASSIAYGAITKRDEIFFYERPDTTSEIVVCAEQAEIFRVKGAVEDYYEVYVISEIYDTLFVKKDDVVLFYRQMGRGNGNGLSDEINAYFSGLDLADNEAEKEAIEKEKEEYDRVIAESKAAVQSSIQASIQARQDEINAQLANGQAAYLGEFTITGYCHCSKCCHGWGIDDPNATAYGSSGWPLVSDYSCAADISVLPYGSHILVNGHEYVVMDTGVYGNWIDIYRSDHDYAESIGMSTTSVYLLSY